MKISAWVRVLAQATCIVVVAVVAIVNVTSAISQWHFHDLNVYWTAAQMFRDNGNPYTPAAATDAATAYRYAPWFAAAWVPLLALPRDGVNAAWSVVLVAAAFVAVWPLVRRPTLPGLLAAALIGSFLIKMAGFGNVQGLMIASLTWGLDRRSGPLWIGVAASLKLFPIVYVLVYAARREWGRVAVATAVAAVLLLPALLFNRPAVTAEIGASDGWLADYPLLWGVAAAGAILAAVLLAWRRSRYAALGAGLAIVLSLPRFFLYDVTYLLPGARRRRLPVEFDRGAR